MLGFSGTNVSRELSDRFIESYTSTIGLLSVLLSGIKSKNLLTCLSTMISLSYAASATLDLLVCVFAPPSSSAVTTSFVTALIKAVTNEVVTAEELGGAKTHTSKSSVADAAYDNDIIVLKQVRRFFDFIPLNNTDKSPIVEVYDSIKRSDNSLDTLVPENPNTPYDMKELIIKIADENDFFEIQKEFAKNILVGFIRVNGSTVGVVANQPMVLAGLLAP